LRRGFDGAQDYDLLLRLSERTDRIAHVPAPLYSWRKVTGSTSADIHAKPDAHRASERALDDAISRRGLDAVREAGIQPTWHRIRYRITDAFEVTGRIENAADEHYEDVFGYATPGRSAYLGINVRL